MHVTILCAHWTFQFHGSCTTHCLKCWLCIPIWALRPRNDFFQKLLSNITIIICSQPFCIPCQSLQRKRKSGSLRTVSMEDFILLQQVSIKTTKEHSERRNQVHLGSKPKRNVKHKCPICSNSKSGRKQQKMIR